MGGGPLTPSAPNRYTEGTRVVSGFYGADVAQLQELAGRYNNAADEIRMAARTIEYRLRTAVAWQGPQADHFRDRWMSEYHPQLQRVGMALEEGGRALRANAAEQDRASAAGSMGLAGGHGQRGGSSSSHEAIRWGELARIIGKNSEGAYELFKKMVGSAELVQEVMKWAGRLKAGGEVFPGLSKFMDSLDIVQDFPRTWADIQSGNIFRFGGAVFRNGWNAAKLIAKPIGLIDTAWNVGIDGTKMLIDIVAGRGYSDRAFDNVGHDVSGFTNGINNWLKTETQQASANLAGGIIRFFSGGRR